MPKRLEVANENMQSARHIWKIWTNKVDTIINLIISIAENEDTKSWGNAKSFGGHSENNCLKWCSLQIRQPKRLQGTMTWVLEHFGVPLLCLLQKRSDLPIVISTLIIGVAKWEYAICAPYLENLEKQSRRNYLPPDHGNSREWGYKVVREC